MSTPHLSEAGPDDVLPSWKEGAARRALLDFIERVTATDSPELLEPRDRIAAFGGAGVLWPGQPYVEAHFALTRIRLAAERDPALRVRQPFKTALANNLNKLALLSLRSSLELISRSHADLSHEQFSQLAAEFLDTAVHPRLGRAYCDLAYRPMRELLELLQANSFQVWVCGTDLRDLARCLAGRLYEIAPHQVLGSGVREVFRETEGGATVWRNPGLATINDHEQKPLTFAQRVGQRPCLTVTSLHDAGDLPMLRFSAAREPSCQLLLRHDDAERELDYEDAGVTDEPFGPGAIVASMKQDWKQVFAPQTRKLTIDLAQIAAPRATISLANSPPPRPDQEG